MMKISIEERVLHFKQPAGTSRGVYTERRIWLLTATDGLSRPRACCGECAPLPDLSCDALPLDYYARCCAISATRWSVRDIDLMSPCATIPSMLFGLETALL